MITCTQGYEFKKDVSSQGCKLIATDGINKIVVADVITTDDAYALYASADVTKDWHSGRWTYQILGATGIDEQGVLKVLPNLEFTNDVAASYWKKVLQQIDERLAGRTIDPANHISVGDKSINYMSVDELLKLRNFVLQRLAEEEEEEGGDTISPDNEKRIKYIWRRG